MQFAILPYQSRQELNRAHPDVTSWQCIFQKPRGMEDTTTIRLNVLRVLEKKQIPIQPVYRVGDFFWIPVSTPARGQFLQDPREHITEQCSCFTYAGDNPDCKLHRRN